MPKETFFNLPEEKREAILDIVIKEFSDNDYKNVSVSRIVKRAGIAKGSFYQYFEDKKDYDCYYDSQTDTLGYLIPRYYIFNTETNSVETRILTNKCTKLIQDGKLNCD